MISKNCEQIQKFVHTFIAIILIQICFQNDGFGFGVFLKNEKKWFCFCNFEDERKHT